MEYLQILQKEIPSIRESDLYVPLKETGINSLDLIVIRVALEKHFGFEISDIEWYKFQSLNEALNYFEKNKEKFRPQKTEVRNITLSKSQEIRMPQMANSALSENWLLKELGDIHWSLLSDGLNKKSSELRDENGNRLYATFVRINYSISPLNHFRENNIIEFKAEIRGFGKNTYLSNISGMSNSDELNACLMTSFSIRDNNDNSKITKSNPTVEANQIEQIRNTPDFLNESRLIKKGLLKDIPSKYGNFRLDEESIWTCIYEINPYYDINGVGLLYFASYPIIADKCIVDYFKISKTIENFENLYYTVFRDIFYLANCNSNDKVIFNLNRIEESDRQIKIISSLYRQSDNKLLAKILNVKQKTE